MIRSNQINIKYLEPFQNNGVLNQENFRRNSNIKVDNNMVKSFNSRTKTKTWKDKANISKNSRDKNNFKEPKTPIDNYFTKGWNNFKHKV